MKKEITWGFSQLLQSKEKKAFLFYYLEGNDEYLVKEAVTHITNTALDPQLRDFNFSRIKGSEKTEARAVYSLCLEFPLMSPVRIVYLEDLQKLDEKERDRLADFLKEELKGTIVILSAITSSSPKGKKGIGKKMESLIKSKAVTVHCSLSESETEEWIIASLKRTGFEIRQDAAQLLRKRIGDDLWMLSTELTKLRSFCGSRRIITRQDVEAISSYTPQAQMYQLTEHITKGNIDGALHIYHEIAGTGEQNFGILFYINRYFLNIISVGREVSSLGSVREAAGKLKKSEYWVKKSAETASSLTGAHIQKISELLLQADVSIKKGKPFTTVMELLIVTLCGLFRRHGEEARRFN
ncbi:MAG: DNA polymerase III subunit delta [Candidatus Xenobiia bacterium LiM19]